MSLGPQENNGGTVVSTKALCMHVHYQFTDIGTKTPGPVWLQGIKEVQKQAAKVKVVHFPKDSKKFHTFKERSECF